MVVKYSVAPLHSGRRSLPQDCSDRVFLPMFMQRRIHTPACCRDTLFHLRCSGRLRGTIVGSWHWNKPKSRYDLPISIMTSFEQPSARRILPSVATFG